MGGRRYYIVAGRYMGGRRYYIVAGRYMGGRRYYNIVGKYKGGSKVPLREARGASYKGGARYISSTRRCSASR